MPRRIREFIMTDTELVQHVLKKTEANPLWFFRQAYLYMETPEEGWFLNWKVRDFQEKGIVPDPVVQLAKRIMEDFNCLFSFRKEVG